MDDKLLENMISIKEYMLLTKGEVYKASKELIPVIGKRFHIEFSKQTKSGSNSIDHMISNIRKDYAEGTLSIYRFFEPPLTLYILHMYIIRTYYQRAEDSRSNT